jgi:hypothetical protein
LSRRRWDNEFTRKPHHASDARVGTTGGTSDLNPIAPDAEFQSRLGVAARGTAPAPYVIAPEDQVETRRSSGDDVAELNSRPFSFSFHEMPPKLLEDPEQCGVRKRRAIMTAPSALRMERKAFFSKSM